MTLRFGILTSSDRCSRGERPDLSGPALADLVTAQGWTVTHTAIVPDDLDALRKTLSTWADSGEMDIILTTGGTGFAPRDITPEATSLVVDRPAPGLAEAMRLESRDQDAGLRPSQVFHRTSGPMRLRRPLHHRVPQRKAH